MIDIVRVRQARKEKGYSQDYIARELGMSRPTYIKFESGTKELTTSQAAILETLLGTSISEDPLEQKENIDKLASMMLAFISLGGSEGDGRITKTKLAKMIYFADAKTYIDRGATMSGMVYRRLPQGPVAYEYLQLVDDLVDQHVIDIKFSGLAQMIGLVEPIGIESLNLRADEVDLIGRIAQAWKDKRTDAIVNYSHEHPTWLQAEAYAPIDMSLLNNWGKSIY